MTPVFFVDVFFLAVTVFDMFETHHVVSFLDLICVRNSHKGTWKPIFNHENESPNSIHVYQGGTLPVISRVTTPLDMAIYRGPVTPFITIVGAHIVFLVSPSFTKNSSTLPRNRRSSVGPGTG